MGKYKLEDFAFGGKYNDYFWNTKYNPNATIENGLANCTTLAYGFAYINHLPRPVSSIVSASRWHKVVANGWTVQPYGSVTIKTGDIIEWSENCHVATVIGKTEGEALLGCSWYTGEHGKSTYDGQYDTRPWKSLQDMNDFFVKNYPFRFYHECSLYEESQRVGGMPEYVLVAPQSVKPVKRDTTRDQIEVLTDEQNIRDNDNNIVSVAQKGCYNVYNEKVSNGHIWYEVANDRYIAGVNGRVVYLPGEDIEALRKENEELKQTIKEVDELIRRWLV